MGIDKDAYELEEEYRNKIKMEIENYILYYTSDDEERKQMLITLDDYMEEAYEE